MTLSIRSLTETARDSETHHALFYGAILVTIVYFLYKSFELSPDTRLFPLFVFSVGIVLLVIRLGSDLLPEFVSDLREAILPEPAQGDSDEEVQSLDEIQDQNVETVSVRRQLKMVAWVVVFTAVMFIIGLVPAIPLLMFVFLLVESDIGILRSLGITAVVFGIVYVLFIEILSVRMYSGMI